MKTIPAIFVLSFATLLFACGKDKFETKPRLEIKDYSTKELYKGQDLRIRLNYFDKEGDLNGGTAFAIKKRLNLLPLGTGAHDLYDTFPNINNPTPLPNFPPTDQGELTFQLNWSSLQESNNEHDTVIFRFVVTDKAGNTSDTIQSDQIVLHKE